MISLTELKSFANSWEELYSAALAFTDAANGRFYRIEKDLVIVMTVDSSVYYRLTAALQAIKDRGAF